MRLTRLTGTLLGMNCYVNMATTDNCNSSEEVVIHFSVGFQVWKPKLFADDTTIRPTAERNTRKTITQAVIKYITLSLVTDSPPIFKPIQIAFMLSQSCAFAVLSLLF